MYVEDVVEVSNRVTSFIRNYPVIATLSQIKTSLTQKPDSPKFLDAILAAQKTLHTAYSNFTNENWNSRIKNVFSIYFSKGILDSEGLQRIDDIIKEWKESKTNNNNKLVAEFDNIIAHINNINKQANSYLAAFDSLMKEKSKEQKYQVENENAIIKIVFKQSSINTLKKLKDEAENINLILSGFSKLTTKSYSDPEILKIKEGSIEVLLMLYAPIIIPIANFVISSLKLLLETYVVFKTKTQEAVVNNISTQNNYYFNTEPVEAPEIKIKPFVEEIIKKMNKSNLEGDEKVHIKKSVELTNDFLKNNGSIELVQTSDNENDENSAILKDLFSEIDQLKVAIQDTKNEILALQTQAQKTLLDNPKYLPGSNK